MPYSNLGESGGTCSESHLVSEPGWTPAARADPCLRSISLTTGSCSCTVHHRNLISLFVEYSHHASVTHPTQSRQACRCEKEALAAFALPKHSAHMTPSSHSNKAAPLRTRCIRPSHISASQAITSPEWRGRSDYRLAHVCVTAAAIL
ncbi:hypothetical protein CBOM_07725 [Ceraceosorus bombacis]|uniref:Uncharacterized protein n=1 Tax=Ceraceosorus bombacis TaxID=401625 RepID=A0A0P1BIF0_9BASI|nr:hypothetical protein CBOM_07725 [Ceraceosorus bombacis]